MRFSYAESMCDPSHYLPLAIEAEKAGYSSFTVPDSICYPEVSDSRYPYTPDGSREFLDGKPFIEPFSLIPALAAVTERLRFTTFVVKLPVRNPVLVAKSVASVAVLSGNRLGFGVGLSPWPEDFQVTETRWEGRGRRMDEMIEILRGLTASGPASRAGDFREGNFFEFHGEFYDLPSVKLCPVPNEPVPLLIGGHSDAALRRAARLGDGWMHAGGDPAALASYLEKLSAFRKEYGTEDRPFEIHVISLDAFTVDGARRLEDQGVSDVIVGFRDMYSEDRMPLQQKVDALRGFADNVVAKLA